MLGWLLDFIPWWIWAPLAAGALFAAWRFLGLRGLLAAAAAVALAFVYRAGRKAGSTAAEAQRERERRKAEQELHEMDREASDIEKAVKDQSDAAAREEALKWAKR